MDSNSMKEKIKAEMQHQVGISFVELQNLIGSDAFGDYAICFPDDENLILWGNCSFDFFEAIWDLMSEKVIVPHPTSVLTYHVDGRVPNLPIARSKPRNGYKKPHWFPITFSFSKQRGSP